VLAVKTHAITIPALLLAALFLVGCTRKKPESLAPAPVAPPPVASTPVVPSLVPPPLPGTPGQASEPTAPVTRSEPVVATPVELDLHRLLVRYYDQHQRPAMTWDDLLRARYIPAIPRGADGKPLDWDTTMQRIGRASDRSRK